MLRVLPLCLLGLVIAACAQPSTPAVTVSQGVVAGVEALPRPPILPLVLAVPSAPIFPLEGLEISAGRAGGADGPEVIELPPSRWELPLPLRMRPLAQLSPEAARFLVERGGPVTAGVFVPADNAVYVASPELAVPMASIAKLVIMLTLFDRVEAEDRALSPSELALLEPMMVWSDNDSASLLWDALGGAEAADAYLQRLAIRGIVPDPLAWGDSYASGPAVAWLLGRLAFGDLVRPEHRELALDLLERAAIEQTWGVGSGVARGTGRPSDGTIIGVKDGWYPVNAGWRAGSAGLIVPGPGTPPGAVPYAIAVLTAENVFLDEGISTIEGFADRVHAALTPREGG